jgi:hypothetical protein
MVVPAGVPRSERSERSGAPASSTARSVFLRSFEAVCQLDPGRLS